MRRWMISTATVSALLFVIGCEGMGKGGSYGSAGVMAKCRGCGMEMKCCDMVAKCGGCGKTMKCGDMSVTCSHCGKHVMCKDMMDGKCACGKALKCPTSMKCACGTGTMKCTQMCEMCAMKKA